MLWRKKGQRQKLKRALPYIFLGTIAIGLLLTFVVPSRRAVRVGPEAAHSFDQKLQSLERASSKGRSGKVSITETELNSKLQEILQGSRPSVVYAPTLRPTAVRLVGNALVLDATALNRAGERQVVIVGTVGVRDHRLEFSPTASFAGATSIPLVALGPNLWGWLNSPEMVHYLALPEWIKDVGVEQGELVVRSR